MAAEHSRSVNGTSTNGFADIDRAGIKMPDTIVKRDGRVVPFDIGRIENAMARCFASLHRAPQTPLAELARRTVNIIAAQTNGDQPTVEGVQDIVEMVLQAAGEFDAAKHYILYRAQQARKREVRPVPEEVRQSFAQSDEYFPTALQKFQFFDKYSRFNYDLGRRETWIETVDRAVDYLHELAGAGLPAETYQRLRQSILEMRAMPSMRLLAMAGPAARRNNIAIYNCSYQPVESIDSFVEALIISMSGCGVGYSVESRYVENFPRVKRQTSAAPQVYTVEDSAEGWADALRIGLETWFEGGDIRFDLSLLRSAGAPLKTKGGRASGPEPLRIMLEFIRSRILARQGSFLRPIDAHDMMCAVGNAAVSGGVRRCLPAGTRVHLERGAVPIEEVVEGDRVMTAEGYKPVTGWVDQGHQQVVEILTESGTVFRCTPHHRVAVLTDVWGGYAFKYARDLTTEDRLLFITHSIDGEPQLLQALPESGLNLIQPELTPETGWLIGKLFADGYVHEGAHGQRSKGDNTALSLTCHTAALNQIERVTAWLEQHGIPARLVYTNSSQVQIRSGNRQFVRWLSLYKPAHEPLRIPESIWRSPADVRAAFLAGLMDGGGWATDRPLTVAATSDEAFARSVVQLLATLGIVAEVQTRQDTAEQGGPALWLVTVENALALQTAHRLLEPHTCTLWQPRKGAQTAYTVPAWMAERDLPRDTYADLWTGGEANLSSATLTSLVEATHYVPVAVVEVREGDEEHTYDIEVRDGSMFVAEGYLVHNTAMISLFDYDDDEMRLCKSGDFERENSQRWNANNSAVWHHETLTQPEFVHRFMEMVDSGRGEPGIFNRQAAIEMRPERRQEAEFGTNPCVTGDTWVLTEQGPRQVRDLVGVPHETLVDGQLYATTEAGFWQTGIKPVLRLTTSQGYTLRLTANHRVLALPADTSTGDSTVWVEAGTLRPGDRIRLHNHRELLWNGEGTFDEGWLLGTLVGAGTLAGKSAHLTFWGEQRAQMAERAATIIRQLPDARADLQGENQPEHHRTTVQSDALRDLAADYGIYRSVSAITPLLEQTSSAFHQGFLQGLFDADGAIVGRQQTGVSVRLAHADPAVLEGVQRMLLRLGIVTTIYANQQPADGRLLPDGAEHELVIGGDNLQVFAELVGFSDPMKQARLAQKLAGSAQALNREPFVATVRSIEPAGEASVYDCSVPDVHAFDANGLYVHNCGEILLRPWEFCNLTAAVARAEDTFDSLRDKVEVATMLGTIQSMATHFPGLRPMWQRNCEEERLLGVDITGQMDSPVAQDAAVKEQLRQVAIEVNRQTAQALGISQSAAITCVKPSGNSSQLLNCSSGLHARWAPYYIRNIRVAAASPLFKVLRDAAVPMDPENGQTPEDATTWVIHFPVKSPDAAATRNDRSAVEQCEFWLQNKLYWTEHNPSVTITYRPEEIIDLMRWVWEHRHLIGGMAFLPAFDANYAQMPYAEVTREEYEQLATAFPPIDFSKVYRYEDKDLTNAAQELACSSGRCEFDL